MKIYFHCVGLAFVIKALEERHIGQARWVEHSDGQVFGVATPLGWHIKQTWGLRDGVTIFPAARSEDPLSDDHVEKLARYGAKAGHSMHDVVPMMMAAEPHCEALDPDIAFPANSF